MALPNNNINIGPPPVLWSGLKEALDKINDNFVALDLATGGTAVDLSVLNTDVSPEYTDTYRLGSITKQWKSIYTAAWADTGAASLNGLWAGSAQIKGKGLTVDLPLGSTVNDQLIIDPAKTFFKTINVNNDLSVEATTFGANVNFNQGLGIALSVDSASESIEFAVDPTFDLNGSIIADDLTTVLVDRAGYLTGNVEVANDWTVTVNSNVWTYDTTGQLEFPGGAVLGEQALVGDVLSSGAGKDLVISTEENFRVITDSSASAAEWLFSSTGELTVPGPIKLEFGGNPIFEFATTTIAGRVVGEAGKSFDISLSDGIGGVPLWSFGSNGFLTFPSLATFGEVPLTGDVLSSGPNKNIQIQADSSVRIIADASNLSPIWIFETSGDLTLPAGRSVIGNTVGYHTGDVKGSVVADDSTILVDGVGSRIVGPVYTGTLRTDETKIALGRLSGNTNQADEAVAVGWVAGYTNQGVRAVAVGRGAGTSDQGTGAVGIGNDAGKVNQGSGAIAIGYNSAQGSQSTMAVAIGYSAGIDTQGENSIGIGLFAGGYTQGISSIAIGDNAGYTGQGASAIAIGDTTGHTNQGSNAIAMGYLAGNDTQGTGAISLGYTAAQITQGDSAVAIGWSAGQTNQGDYAIAIGYRAGFINQNASSIVLNASGAALEAPAAGFFVNPIRNQAGTSGGVLQYNTATSEISYSSSLGAVSGTFTGNIFTTLIDSADSSAITFTPSVVFNSQVTVEGTLTVNDGITGYISLAKLKAVVAASADFADFQTRIAAL